MSNLASILYCLLEHIHAARAFLSCCRPRSTAVLVSRKMRMCRPAQVLRSDIEVYNNYGRLILCETREHIYRVHHIFNMPNMSKTRWSWIPFFCLFSVAFALRQHLCASIIISCCLQCARPWLKISGVESQWSTQTYSCDTDTVYMPGLISAWVCMLSITGVIFRHHKHMIQYDVDIEYHEAIEMVSQSNRHSRTVSREGIDNFWDSCTLHWLHFYRIIAGLLDVVALAHSHANILLRLSSVIQRA